MGGDDINKQEREFYLGQLETEKQVLKALKRQYERALQDIVNRIRILQSDELTQSRIYQIDYQKALKKQIEAILAKLQADEYDTIHKYLKESYTDGFVGAMYNMSAQDGIHVITPIDQKAAVKAIVTDSKLTSPLYNALGTDMKTLKRKISEEITRGIATALPYAKIVRNITNQTNMPFANAKRIVKTESHRIQEASAEDARQAAKSRGADVVKMWDASLDSKTRPLHRRLDGQIKELDEPFESGGYTAMYPGDFGDPAQDCNCRCVALTRARWELNEDELEILKKRAEYFGLDKTSDFEEYKKKYLKAVKTVENTGKSGIIKERGNLSLPVAKFTGYALNPSKDIDKATAFKKALGYDMTNAEALIDNILDHVDEGKLVPKTDKGFGMLYEYIVQLTGPNGKKANVLTAWIQDGKKKRLTSAYVTEKKVTEDED